MTKKTSVVLALIFAVTLSAYAKPKKKTYNNSADQVFQAALRTARERHVVTYVDEKQLMVTFETGKSFTSEGFVANASVEPEADNKATLILNVQNKKGMSWGAGDRMADKFFQQVNDELAGDVKQASAVKPQEAAIAVPEPKAIPKEPSMTKPAGESAGGANDDKGKILVTSVPDAADVFVDDAFVGNTPATLRLSPGKHTIKVSQTGYKAWTKDLSVIASSEVSLKAALDKE
ncbi:MAG TPA: PEGA domain-containing protein [Candidatus Angelobacter sp.]|nr:PEGA domain-containing protein [Candidatus Angelobacter sp.]